MHSEAIQYLLQEYELHRRTSAVIRSGVTVSVDEIAAKVARFYEHIRNVVDYREEHLLRKNSILRALQRGLLIGAEKNFAETLIKEIIRSGHLPNDTIPEERIADIDAMVANLRRRLSALSRLPAKERSGLSQWLVRITACAIEEALDPPVRDRLMADTMFLALKDRMVIKGRVVEESERVIQLFIGIQRALVRADEDQLSWRLLMFLYPAWNMPEALEQAPEAPLAEIKRSLDLHLADALGSNFYAFCNRSNTVFLLLGDVLFLGEGRVDAQKLFGDDAALRGAVAGAYAKRFEQQKKRMRRLAFFTVISLFITKVLVALAVEIPIDRFLTRDFSWITTAVNIAFPPLLMFVIILLIRLPSEKNLRIIETEVRAAVYARHAKQYIMVIPEARHRALGIFVRMIYVVLSLAVLYWTWRMLTESLHFSAASVVVFVLFTSIVAATGVRVQNRSKEISMEERKPSLLGFVADVLFMPFVTLGQAVVAGLARFRFLAIIVDLIDAPFQAFVIFVENFNAFIRSKKEELH